MRDEADSGFKILLAFGKLKTQVLACELTLAGLIKVKF
jgi:hypothetical protein